ncbi:cell division protein ZapA [Parasphingorhabdus sp.]|jgi:cell division protein ZapA|uniref:cell division protein ZapA n=1 Tax=Parasphingorhabdus sp. TaxID=2709688 RepID=UPI0030B00790|nr:cell division protein ZapA [Sphingomonadales bacterium]
MAQMKLEIGGRSFMVTCQDGEEDHLTKLAAMVDGKARESGDPAGLNESRMLLFTSLLLADELHSARSAITEPAVASAPAKPDPMDEQAIAALEKLADRAEQLANSLE